MIPFYSATKILCAPKFSTSTFTGKHSAWRKKKNNKKKIMTSPRKQSQNILSTMWLATFVGHKSPCLSVTEGPMAIITSQINIQDIGGISACAGTWPWMMVIFFPWSFWNAVLLYSVFVPIVRNGTWPWINIFVPSNVSFDVLLHKWKNPDRKGLMALCFFYCTAG